MTIDEALKILLRDELDSDRVWNFQAPQGTSGEPYVVIYRISPTPRHVQTGPVPTIEWRYQFSCFGKLHTPTAALADSLRRVLDGYQGSVSDGASPESVIPISSCMWAGGTYHFNDATAMHHFAVDMQIKYREA